jgi:hypothetical protein
VVTQRVIEGRPDRTIDELRRVNADGKTGVAEIRAHDGAW